MSREIEPTGIRAWNSKERALAAAPELSLNDKQRPSKGRSDGVASDGSLSHNIAKLEKHEVNEELRCLCVHSKGATGAFPPGHRLVPKVNRQISQPALVPGDMGRYSYFLVGTRAAMKAIFARPCNGAGRLMSLAQFKKVCWSLNMDREIVKRGIVARNQG
jgi:RNA-splicing ligase RtcB